MKLLFATHNQGKLREARSILSDLNLEVLSIGQANQQTKLDLTDLDVVEIKDTFRGNALLKAQAFAEVTSILTAADDSGLQVNALNGFPGVKSARWLKGSDQQRNQGILKKLQGQSNRSAKFVTVVCVYDPRSDTDQKNSSRCFTGEILGTIAQQPQGEEGFGYDPIFIPQGETQTFAKLGPKNKNQQSHRRLALEKLKKYLRAEYDL